MFSCIRSFIIKSIHAIVQARNGVVYNTNCISAVGARNNLMVNVEEDPEIGATIKQTLESGFPVRVQDLISLEILTAWPTGERMVVEVWQFHLDTAERLDRSRQASPSIDKPETPSPDEVAATSHPEGIAIEDFRQSRLFEKLGTLLKAVITTTRLLPAYRLSRNQDPSRYQMCYTLRRGAVNLARLGLDVRFQQVGRLFSGLAMKPSIVTVPSDSQKATDSPDSLDHVYLSCTIHFRCKPPVCPISQPKIPTSSWVRTPTTVDRCALPSRVARALDQTNREEEYKPYPHVYPAFANNHSDDPQDDQENAHPMFLHGRYTIPNRGELFDKPWAVEGVGSDVDDIGDDLGDGGFYDSENDEAVLQSKSGHNSPLDPGLDDVRQGEHPAPAPLQLPFSTVGVTGDRLTHLFVELRENANLDLFQVPPNPMGSASAAQSALFDADALSNELDRHEKILKEFDDFLAVFCPVEPFDADVRPLVPLRPTPFSVEPS